MVREKEWWVMKNEALRLFLAVTALILTALLTSPMSGIGNPEGPAKSTVTKVETKSKSARTFAFFYRR